MPAVSVIIPAHNAEPYIGEAIRSVLNQSYRDFELLVWDDGSTDDTAKAAARAIDEDPRCRVVRARHQGLTPTLAEAYAQTTAAYVGQVDADDRLHRDALLLCRARLERTPAAGFIYTRHRHIAPDGRVLGPGRRDRTPYDANLLLLQFMTFHFRLYRRTAFDAVGGWDLSYARAQDYDLCLRLADHASVLHIPKTLYDYRVHPDSVSQQHMPAQQDAALRAVNAALLRRGEADHFRVVATPAGRFHLIAL